MLALMCDAIPFPTLFRNNTSDFSCRFSKFSSLENQKQEMCNKWVCVMTLFRVTFGTIFSVNSIFIRESFHFVVNYNYQDFILCLFCSL